MTKLLLILCCCVSLTVSAQTDSPAGRWKTLDEDTGEAKSIIEIYVKGRTFDGRIAEILTGNTTAVCTECDGKLKGAPILGMQIIDGLEPDDEDMVWAGGTIFDPQKGASYKLVVWFEPDEPDVLYVRGKHWTGLYRTQRWVRE
ncbi:hypothetical protein LEM8419_00578 [Neolewinella maritima]|uniref:DUF2147 domain-containing protein n=1 Tax=Neolewinella maritima TaxID=1383882 RepID=A0ABM9AXL0_9BACT|nr:DUF2147 domain-containing protein [Neolewinella maritima]CAH0999280.1 hypothetical protein LEM8419_00578 [Neolewinella maritima]